MRVAVDAMGGDHAPGAIVRGAVQARQGMGSGEVILVGDRARIEPEIERCGGDLAGISVVHASEVVEMAEAPVKALKKKPDSSIQVCVRLATEGRADGIISAGNTGAVVAAALMAAERLPGVKRPGIAVSLPHATGRTTLIDVGANIKGKPFHLYQNAVMGAVYTQHALGVENPRVGLLTIGEEDAKGNDLISHAHRLIKLSGLNFVGNVEGQDIHGGVCDVVACDGFTGNVVLKVCEGLGAGLLQCVEQELLAQDGVVEERVKSALTTVRAQNDAATYGGAPLLGINGIVLICHGRSDERHIVSAIRHAATFDAGHVNERIVQDLEERGIHRWSGLGRGNE